MSSADHGGHASLAMMGRRERDDDGRSECDGRLDPLPEAVTDSGGQQTPGRGRPYESALGREPLLAWVEMAGTGPRVEGRSYRLIPADPASLKLIPGSSSRLAGQTSPEGHTKGGPRRDSSSRVLRVGILPKRSPVHRMGAAPGLRGSRGRCSRPRARQDCRDPSPAGVNTNLSFTNHVVACRTPDRYRSGILRS